MCRVDDGLDRARIVEGTDGVGTPRKVDRKAKGGLQRVREGVPSPKRWRRGIRGGCGKSAGEGRWSDETRWLVWNGVVTAPRVRTVGGVVFADGRGAVEAVEVQFKKKSKEIGR